ncbi:MAG: cation transporter [Candidatus Glassbacteria bacterium]|nr:cation transporter [Candidatus Glassbacteria bacterium]
MKQNEQVSLYSILVNTTLFILKGGAAFLSGSISAMAEAIHSSIDLLASVIVFIGLKISKQKSERFPYGLYKVENLVSVLVAGFILYAGYEIVLEIISGEYNPIRNIYLVFGLYVIVFIITYAFSRYELKAAEKIGSPSLMADGKHIRIDMFSVGAVMTGFVGEFIGFRIDKIAALVIVFFILKTSLELIVNTVKVLLDGSLDEKEIAKIRKIIMAESLVKQVKELRGRNSGNYVFIEANIVIDSTSFSEAHKATERIERAVKSALNNVEMIRIHYEPTVTDLTEGDVSLNERKKGFFGKATNYASGIISEVIKAKGCKSSGYRRRRRMKDPACYR